MLAEKSVHIILISLIIMPFIICIVYRSNYYKNFQKRLGSNRKLYSKVKIILLIIWFFSFSTYLLFIDSLPFELGNYGALSYLTFPIILMLLGGSLYQKSLISLILSLSYTLWSFIGMGLMGKFNYYDRFLRSGEPVGPFITTFFIPFSIIISIIFLLSGVVDTILKKFSKHSYRF